MSRRQTFVPTGEQLAAATSEQANTMVVAPPGCGKTELLAHRAQHLIQSLEPNQRILALTFTNRAQANLKERLRQSLGVESMRRFVAVHNFHGHATQVVLAHGRTIGLDLETLTLPTTKTLAKALQATERDAGRRRDAANLLGEIKRTTRTDSGVLQAIEAATGRPGRDAALSVEVDRQVKNALHYEDLLRHAQHLLNIPAISNLYCRHYGAMLVDEFQDLSLQQLDIAHKSCTASRTFAGDPLQGIYSWAGADPIGVEAILRKLSGEPVTLSTSYRSSPEVLSIVNSIGTQLGAVALAAADPDAWHQGGFGATATLKDRDHEAQVVLRISQMLLERDPTTTIGVITRSGWRRQTIDAVFGGEDDIPVRRWDLALDDPSIVEMIRSAISRLPKATGFDAARDAILDSLDPADVDTMEQVQDAFDQLKQVSAKTPRGAIAALRNANPEHAISPGVHLLNAHTGKGQQFDWVVVIGLEERHVPDRRSSEGAALDEEFRVLLVMLSRARHGLVVTKIRTLDGQYGPYAAKPSRWSGPLSEASTSRLKDLEDHLSTWPDTITS